jgi:hypothetical protein
MAEGRRLEIAPRFVLGPFLGRSLPVHQCFNALGPDHAVDLPNERLFQYLTVRIDQR